MTVHYGVAMQSYNRQLALKKLEEISTTENGTGVPVRLSDRDWYLIHWLFRAAQHRGDKRTQTDIIRDVVRDRLEALFANDRALIDELRQIELDKERRLAAITQQPLKPAPGKKKKPSQ